MRWVDTLDQMVLLGSIGTVEKSRKMKTGTQDPWYEDYGKPFIGGRRLATHTAVPTWLDGERIEEA